MEAPSVSATLCGTDGTIVEHFGHLAAVFLNRKCFDVESEVDVRLSR